MRPHAHASEGLRPQPLTPVRGNPPAFHPRRPSTVAFLLWAVMLGLLGVDLAARSASDAWAALAAHRHDPDGSGRRLEHVIATRAHPGLGAP